MIRSRGWRMISRRHVSASAFICLASAKPRALLHRGECVRTHSASDPFPCVVHEAMAAETPVIAFSGVGGAPEALEGGCGIIVPFGDIAAMAEAVLASYRDADAAKRRPRSPKSGR